MGVEVRRRPPRQVVEPIADVIAQSSPFVGLRLSKYIGAAGDRAQIEAWDTTLGGDGRRAKGGCGIITAEDLEAFGRSCIEFALQLQEERKDG